MRKIKKLLLILCSVFMGIMSSVYGIVEVTVPPVAMYGVETPISFWDRMLSFLKIILIPVVLIYGIIEFCKKKIKNKKNDKENLNSNKK